MSQFLRTTGRRRGLKGSSSPSVPLSLSLSLSLSVSTCNHLHKGCSGHFCVPLRPAQTRTNRVNLKHMKIQAVSSCWLACTTSSLTRLVKTAETQIFVKSHGTLLTVRAAVNVQFHLHQLQRFLRDLLGATLLACSVQRQRYRLRGTGFEFR